MGLAHKVKVWRHRRRVPDDFLDGCDTDFIAMPQTPNADIARTVLLAGVPEYEHERVLGQYRALFPEED